MDAHIFKIMCFQSHDTSKGHHGSLDLLKMRVLCHFWAYDKIVTSVCCWGMSDLSALGLNMVIITLNPLHFG